MQQPPDAELPDAKQWRRIRDVLHQALDLPAEYRSAFLDDVCKGDEALRAELDSLLAASARPVLLDRPALAGLPTITMDEATRPSPLKPGQALSHYQIIEKIGEGGMGEVYKGTDKLLGRVVALKVMRDPGKSWQNRERFAREAKAASALNHSNIVTIYEFNTEVGVDFIAMEYVEGVTLKKLLGDPLEKLLGYALQAAGAIAKAHAAGIVHRDLKPGNIMVTPQGVVKVLDFGLAKHQDSSDDPAASKSLELTLAGALIGTPAYMSPEQAMGEPASPASDVFCFGIILYEIACGKRPFEGSTALATLDQLAHKEPPPPAEVNPTVPRELVALIKKCLKKAPAERPQSMAEVAAAIESIPTLRAKRAMMNRRRWVFAGAATVICAAAGLYFGIGRPAPPPVLNYSIEAQKSAADQPYYASPSDTFEGGWKFRLHLQPPPSGFLYVVNQGPGQNGTERFWILYSAPVKPRQDVVTGWYVFDQNPGTERLWVVWEPQPAAELNRTGEVKDSAAAARIRDILSELQPETGKPGKATGLATLLELRHR